MLNIFKNSFIRSLSDLRIFSQARFYEKNTYTRRYGYREKVMLKGLLPRSKDFGPLTRMPQYKPHNAWCEKRAMFGQNDYIDILGDGNIHPTELLTNIPYWLRGIKANEYRRVRRQINYLGNHYSHVRPTKYFDLVKRAKYLHKVYNNALPNK